MALVVKVGGSLFDVPDLGKHLGRWLAGCSHPIILFPGGGELVNAVRRLDQIHSLGEEAAHWLAIQALDTSAHFLHSILPHSVLVEDLNAWRRLLPNPSPGILVPYRFFREDELQGDRLPRSWEVTSDSLAARVAVHIKADELILLKSVDSPESHSGFLARDRGIVDDYFPTMAATGLKTGIVNFRRWISEHPTDLPGF